MDPKENEKHLTGLLEDVLRQAQTAGADHAEAAASIGEQFTRGHRNRDVETHERGESKGVTLRVFVGDRPAVVSGNDWSKQSIANLVDRAIAIARSVPKDPESLPAAMDAIKHGPHEDFDRLDNAPASLETLIESIAAMEDAALSVPGVSTLDSASASYSSGTSGLMISNGFQAFTSSSRTSFYVDAIAKDGNDNQVSYDYDSKTHYKDLRSPHSIGLLAGSKAVGKLEARKIASQRLPVIFDRDVSGGILGEFAAAVNGFSVSRELSFLHKSMGQQIFNSQVTIVDDPHRRRGLGSRAFDAEGIATRELTFVDQGLLNHWLLDLRSARRLGLSVQGNAVGMLGRQPSAGTSNLFMKAGKKTVNELYKSFGQALLVHECMGQGGNTLTGDYSIGVSGVMLENGEKAYPVDELTIAGSLNDIFLACEPADDLIFRGSTNAPTLYVGTMVVGGRTNA